MRIGAALVLVFAILDEPSAPPRAAQKSPSASADRDRASRGPYILRQIFGDLPQSSPSLWGVVPGIQRGRVPAKVDLGKEQWSADSPPSFLREVAGRATVIFVFEGRDPEARLDHVTVTVFESPRITRKAVLLHLSRVYGPPDPESAGGQAELVASWQNGAIVLRHFPAARFFEVTLSHPRPRA